MRSEAAFGRYNRIPNSLLRDPGELDIRPQHAKRSWEFWKRDGVVEDLSSLSSSANDNNNTTTELPDDDGDDDEGTPETSPSNPYQGGLRPDAGSQYPIGSSPNFKKGFSFLPDTPANPDTLKQRAIPAPTLRYDPSTMTLRERRFLGLPYGGTVVVHYLKRNEWFLETALALIGRENFWDTGLDAPAYPRPIPPRPAGSDHAGGGGKDNEQETDTKPKPIISTIPTWNGKGGEAEIVAAEWGSARMYGSPLVRDNGFVSMGRTVPWDALQKSEQGKYGNLKGSPRQRYVDIPGNDNDHDHDNEKEDESESTSLSSSIFSSKDTSSSSSLTSRDKQSSSSSNDESNASSSSSTFSSSSSSSGSAQSSVNAEKNDEQPSSFVLSGHPDLHMHSSTSSSSSLVDSHVLSDHLGNHHSHIQHSSSSKNVEESSSSSDETGPYVEAPSVSDNAGLHIQHPAALNLA